MTKFICVIEDEQVDQLLDRMKNQITNVMAVGLVNSCKDVVSVARSNALACMRSKTGKLFNSLSVLAVRTEVGKAEVDVGSDLPGYPFFQEFGWTSYTGRFIPAKLFFSSAVWSTIDKVSDDVQSHISQYFGGS
jgi:hypothetical protein